jgi:L-methionine (R)-S-oxide reductase
MRVNYDELSARLRALCAGERDEIALMASVACEVYHSDARFDWVGFYRNMGDRSLKIGPYQGGHGCLTIAFSRGVCGAAARTGKTQLVPDVAAFADHIACASSTRSEIVLPVFDGLGNLRAVFDIDSNQPAAFDARDQAALEALLAEIFAIA